MKLGRLGVTRRKSVGCSVLSVTATDGHSLIHTDEHSSAAPSHPSAVATCCAEFIRRTFVGCSQPPRCNPDDYSSAAPSPWTCGAISTIPMEGRRLLPSINCGLYQDVVHSPTDFRRLLRAALEPVRMTCATRRNSVSCSCLSRADISHA